MLVTHLESSFASHSRKSYQTDCDLRTRFLEQMSFDSKRKKWWLLAERRNEVQSGFFIKQSEMKEEAQLDSSALRR